MENDIRGVVAVFIATAIYSFIEVYGFNRIEAYLGSLVLLFDIIAGITLGMIFLKEYPNYQMIFGIAIISLAIAIPNITGFIMSNCITGRV